MNFISNLINTICEPNPKLIKDQLLRKMRSKHHRVILLMHVLVISSLSLYIVLSQKRPSIGQVSLVFMHISNLLIFCLTCRSYPFIYKAYYVFYSFISGPLAVYFSLDGVFGAWSTVGSLPIFVMYYCENYMAGIGVMICQVGYLNRIYKPLMLQILFDMDSETYIQRLTMSYAYSTAFNTIILYIIGFCLQKSYIDELRIAEGKREHLQKQKHFLLSFSSELRNLVQHMAGNIQMALLEETSQKIRDYLENSEAGIRLLLSMINNILDTGKIQVGELEINPTSVVFQETLEKMWGVCSYLLKEKNLTGSLKIHKNIPQMLKVDEYRLMQILLNLIGNAVKYTEKGSVNIILEWRRNKEEDLMAGRQFLESDQHNLSDNNYITVGIESRKWTRDEENSDESPGILKITVTDTGCGIEAEKLVNIFERHPTQDETDVKARLSPGLGLYITKQLCNRMRGEISVASFVGEGTTFVTCLPVEPVKAEKGGRIMTLGSFTELANWWKFRVLVVDDMNFNINILSNYFKKLGIPTTDIAQNGQEAVEKYIKYALEGNRFQIVTMDVEMPKMNGKEAAHKIREFEKKCKLKPCLLIMVSGNCSESEINECLIKDGEIGADYFLKKPATFDDLFNVVSRHFSTKIYNSQEDKNSSE